MKKEYDTGTDSTGRQVSNNNGFEIADKTISVTMGEYFAIVELGTNDRFLRIREIGMKRNFMTIKQRAQQRDLHDIEHLFEEEE